MARKPARRSGRGLPAESFVAGLMRLLGRRVGARWVATLRCLGRLPPPSRRRRENEGGGNNNNNDDDVVVDPDPDSNPERKET